MHSFYYSQTAVPSFHSFGSLCGRRSDLFIPEKKEKEKATTSTPFIANFPGIDSEP